MRPMLRPTALAAALLCAALPAAAQTLSAEEFDAYTRGRTLSYAFEGTPYGIEEYLPGRRVRWAFVGDECRDGVWYDRNGMICFLYDHAPTDEQCWTFERTDQGLRGIYQGPDGPGRALYEVLDSDTPLVCRGPDVGA